MSDSLPPLCEIAVPPSWKVKFHELRLIYPENLDEKDSDWELLSEDLLQIENGETGILLDVGWYPEASSSGEFKLVLIQGKKWESPLLEYRTHSLDEIVARIEANLFNTSLLESAAIICDIHKQTLSELSNFLDNNTDINDAVDTIRLLSEKYGEEAIPVLTSHLTDPCARIRYAVVDALKQIGHPSVGETLHNRFLLPDPDIETRRLLLRALGAVGYTPAIPTLISWLQNPDSQQRAATAWSLGILQAKEALPSITDAYATERNRSARSEMKTALHRLSHST